MQFDKIIKGDQPVLVDFYADWCGPCKMMAPGLKDFAGEMAGRLKVLKVDVDRNRKAAMKYNIQSIPTLILFHKGKIKWRQSGALQKPQLKAAIEPILKVNVTS